MTDARPVEIIDIGGAPYERGRSLGIARGAAIERCIRDWLDSLRSAGVSDPESHIARLLAETRFGEAIREHTPDLLDEVRGIVDGSGLPEQLVFAVQLMDEEWSYRAALVEKCSSLAFHIPDAVVVGQNMDLGEYTDGHQVIHRIAPYMGVPGALVFTISPMIALLGVNSSGVAVCVNSVPQLPSALSGLPVSFVIRRLLQARDVGEAVNLVRRLPHATGQHYLLADSREIRSFEASAAGVHEYLAPDPSCVTHTNHPLAGEKGSGKIGASTRVRLATLDRRLRSARAGVEDARVALAASDHPDYPVSIEHGSAREPSPSTGMPSFTTGSMISTLRRDADEVEAWVSPGPPSVRGWTRVVVPVGTSAEELRR
ncbi:C45 family autoproteolytic acyltransferase/hydolase [Phytohabitans kaempferiae]|uniref:C45 family autoproteolytic acyltransferase/hydrolase n=1 Tax=Phytohabitans kaempferiae TaxID=1620943 RepID=A0ABV6M7P3_9ACTN